LTKLSHRERFYKVIHHQIPDRLPMDLMGNATMLLDQTYFRLRDSLGLAPIPPFRTGSTANYYDERILEYLDIDFRRLMLKENPQHPKDQLPDGSFRDAWGILSRNDGMFVNAVEFPLSQVTTVEQVDSHPWPAAEDLFCADGLRQQAKALYHETDYVLVARNPLTFGFLDRACQLMGNAAFLMTMADQPELTKSLLAHILQIHLDTYSLLLEAVGPYVQMVEYGDDLGGQQGPLISPAMYREYIQPLECELFDLIHRNAPGAAIFRHSDGNIYKLIDDMIEAGIQVLNPVQKSVPGMQAARLKQEFGDRLVFHGAVEKMEGSPDELVADVKTCIDELGEGGGYILSCCNHMIDVSPENIVLMYQTAREYSAFRKDEG
jgi:uroporphyrinogen decarboxylase